MLSDDERREVELDIARDFLDTHKPYTRHGIGTTEDPHPGRNSDRCLGSFGADLDPGVTPLGDYPSPARCCPV